MNNQIIISSNSLAKFNSEMNKVLGWYAFNSYINVGDPNRLEGYPEYLILVHESNHQSLTQSSLYGQSTIDLATILRNAKTRNVNPPFADCEQILSIMIKNMFIIQEATANYQELLSCACNFNKFTSDALSKLPTDYLACMRLLEGAVLPVKDILENVNMGVVCSYVGITIARCCLDNKRFSKFSNPKILTLSEITGYLKKESPDLRFVEVCETITRRGLSHQLREIWVDLTIKTAFKMGIDIITKSGTPVYSELDSKSIDEIGLNVQPQFLKKMTDLGIIKFPLVAEVNDRRKIRNQIISCWRNYMNQTDNPDLYPKVILKEGATDAWKETLSVHHVREKYPAQKLLLKPKLMMQNIVSWAITKIKSGFAPIISIEEAENKEIIAVAYAFSRQKPPNEFRFSQSDDVSIVRLDEIDLKNFGFAHWLSLSQEAKQHDEKILWHCHREIFHRMKLIDFVKATQGRIFISCDFFEYKDVSGLINELLKCNETVFIRPLKFYELQNEFMVVHAKGARVYSCWPCTRYDYNQLEKIYKDNKNVIVVTDKMEFGYGATSDEMEEILTLLSIAYFGFR